MSIQIAGFAGSNVFQPSDAPRYTNGFIICGVCSLAGAIVVLAWKALYAWDDKRRPAVTIEEPMATLPHSGNDDEKTYDLEKGISQ